MTLTQQYLDRQLFGGNGAQINLYYVDNFGIESTLYLDREWRRIAYSSNNSLSLILKSYGDNPGELLFKNPTSMDVNEWGEIYVCDRQTRVIYKLIHSSLARSITAPQNVNFITDLNKPLSIDYYSGNTFFDRSDDRLVVADEGDNSIRVYDYTGTLLYAITGYYENGVTTINRPVSVILYGFESPYRLAFIERGTNRLICARLPQSSATFPGWVYPASVPTKLEGAGQLNYIGIDGCYNLLVSDTYKNLINKYNIDGKYVCSYSGTGEFRSPIYISNVPDNIHNPDMVWVDFTISSKWYPGGGLRRYLPGGCATNFQFSNHTEYYRFKFLPQDRLLYKLEIIRQSDNSVVLTKTGEAFTMLNKELLLAYEELPYNNTGYTWKFSYLPRYNDYYGEYSVPWETVTGSFYHTQTTPVIAQITQSISPLCKNSITKLTATLSQGNGNLNYNWTPRDFPAGMSIVGSTSGSSIFVQWLDTEPFSMVPVVTVVCTVSSIVGSDTEVKAITLGQNCSVSGCPFVYTWNGEVWLEDNNILPQSQLPGNEGQDVTDYYQLFTTPVLTDGKYSLAIGEFEQEKSYLDQVKLLVIEHSVDTYVAIDDSGAVTQYYKPTSFASALLDSSDVLKQLMIADSLTVSASEGDTLALSFEDVSVGGEKVLVILARSPIAKDRPAGRIVDKANRQFFSSFRLRKNLSYQWVAVPDNQTSSMQVDLVWEKEVEIDYTELSYHANMPFTLYTPELLLAEHSSLGSVTDNLLFKDENYVELNTGEQITLDFSAPPEQEGMQRTFVLMSRGRYETMLNKYNLTVQQEPQLPAVYNLYDNHPNPFNPETIISYQLPKAGIVTLKVYDILGREVMTLVNEQKEAGKYDVPFNAHNLASGVYLYELRVNDYKSVKKMNLLK